MWKWFKAQSPSVKGMIIICILSIIGIIIRWDHVSGEVGEAFSNPFSDEKQEPAVKSDSIGGKIVPDSLQAAPADSLTNTRQQ